MEQDHATDTAKPVDLTTDTPSSRCKLPTLPKWSGGPRLEGFALYPKAGGSRPANICSNDEVLAELCGGSAETAGFRRIPAPKWHPNRRPDCATDGGRAPVMVGRVGGKGVPDMCPVRHERRCVESFCGIGWCWVCVCGWLGVGQCMFRAGPQGEMQTQTHIDAVADPVTNLIDPLKYWERRRHTFG